MSRKLTPTEAAAIIGCSESHCRALIRTRRLRASSVVFHGRKFYEIDLAEAKRFRDTPKTTERGWPRGKKRG